MKKILEIFSIKELAREAIKPEVWTFAIKIIGSNPDFFNDQETKGKIKVTKIRINWTNLLELAKEIELIYPGSQFINDLLVYKDILTGESEGSWSVRGATIIPDTGKLSDESLNPCNSLGNELFFREKGHAQSFGNLIYNQNGRKFYLYSIKRGKILPKL